MFNNNPRRGVKDRWPIQNNRQQSSNNSKFPEIFVNKEFVKSVNDARGNVVNPVGVVRLGQVADNLAEGYIKSRSYKNGTVVATQTQKGRVYIGSSNSLIPGTKPVTNVPSTYGVQEKGRSPHKCGEPKAINSWMKGGNNDPIKGTVAVFKSRNEGAKGKNINRCDNCIQYPCLGEVYSDNLNGNLVPPVTNNEKARGIPHLRAQLKGPYTDNASEGNESRYFASTATPDKTYHGVMHQRAGSNSAQQSVPDFQRNKTGSKRHSIGTSTVMRAVDEPVTASQMMSHTRKSRTTEFYH